MPRLDGRGLLDFVRLNSEIAKRSAFIYMTASERIISPVLASDLQAADIPLLRKPFDLATLTGLVEDAQTRLGASVGAYVSSHAVQDEQVAQDASAGPE